MIWVFTIQVSVDCRPPLSVTVNSKVRDSPFGPTSGAVNEGCIAFVLDRLTAGPPVCVHW